MKLLKDTCVLVKANTAEEVNEHGIVLAGSEAGKKLEQGEVIEVGGQVSKVKIGDNVIFKMYHTHTITVEDDDYEVIEEDDLIATV